MPALNKSLLSSRPGWGVGRSCTRPGTSPTGTPLGFIQPFGRGLFKTADCYPRNVFSSIRGMLCSPSTSPSHHYVGWKRNSTCRLRSTLTGYPWCRIRPLDTALKDLTNLESPPTTAVTTTLPISLTTVYPMAVPHLITTEQGASLPTTHGTTHSTRI